MPGPQKRRSWSYTRGFLPHLELPPWREQHLPLATAQALAALIDRAGLGRCAVIPGAKEHTWDVLVELGPVRGHGELVVLATLGDAAPLLGRAFGIHIQRHGRDTGPPSSQAERQIREALVDVLAERAVAERGEETKP
jgi:hypothetical protein